MTEPTPPGPPAGPSASRAVLGHGAFYTIATAAPALAAVAVIPVVTRVLPVAQYDVVAVATVVIQVGFVLVALGMGAAITREYVLAAGGAVGARALVLRSAVLSVAVTGLALLAAPWWSPLVLGRPASVELVLALVASLGGAWMVLAQAYLRGADRPVPFIVLAVLASLVGPALGLLAVVLGERTATTYLVGVAAGFVAAGLLGLVVVVRSGPARGSMRALRAALRIGVPTVPHQVSLYLALAGLVVIADRMLGDGGRANIALTVGAGATVVTAGLNNAWAPLVYRTAPADRGRVLDETTRSVALVILVIAGAVALLAPWVLRVAAPGSFDTDSMVPVVAVVSAAAVPSVLYLASAHLVFASGSTTGLALTTPVAVAIGLASAVLAAPHWGLVGVGAGYLVTYLFLALFTTALQRRVATPAWWPPLLLGLGGAWVAVSALGAVLPVHGAAAWWRVGALAVVTLGCVLVGRRHLRSVREVVQPSR